MSKEISSSQVEYLPCDKKCQYNMYYNKEPINVKNTGYNISITYNPSSTKSIVYGGSEYTVNNLKIVSPPIHTFNGNQIIGEVIIEHQILNSSSSSNILNVCIPINNTSLGSSKGSDIIANIITAVSTNANKKGESTSQGINPFSIVDIIPDAQYYFYTDLNNKINIVFDLKNAYVLNNNIIEILNSIIIETYQITDGDFEYNDSINESLVPPINGKTNTDIYIDCTAVNDGTYEDALVYKNGSNSGPNTTIFTASTIQTIWTFVTIFVIIVIFMLVVLLAKYIAGDKIVPVAKTA